MHSAKDTAVTRESKLALILSFVLILVVGVLVSDHFSQANTMDPDLLDALGRQPIAALPGSERTRTNNAIDQVLPENYTPPAQAPIELSNGSDRSGTSRNGANRNGSLLGELSGEISRTMEDLRTVPLANPTSNSNTAQTQGRTLAGSSSKAYVVVGGDSLYQIARSSLGDGDRWTEIQALNSSIVGRDGAISPGMKLVLPGNARVSAPARRVEISQRKVQQSKTYTVAAGDTLGEISFELLGTSRRVSEFVELNALKSANDIRVGMKLKIPVK